MKILFIIPIALLVGYLIKQLLGRAQPEATYIRNAASLEWARPLTNDERRAQWSVCYYASGHHKLKGPWTWVWPEPKR